MIRFILVILTAFLYLILSIPVLLVLLLIRKKKPEVCDKVSRSLIRWYFRVILVFPARSHRKGQEIFRRTGLFYTSAITAAILISL
mgnify:CR=1 FL=1